MDVKLIQPNPTSGRKSRRSRRGFTLIEAMCSMCVLALLMLGAISMYVGELQLESRTQADASGGGAGAGALRQIAESAREGLYYLLPQETLSGNQVSFTTQLAVIANSGNIANTSNPAARFANYGSANFISAVASSTCYTGMFLAYPAPSSAINIVTSSGSTPSAPVKPYDATKASTAYVLFFRSDTSGNPAPSNGVCLWEVGRVNGATVDQAVLKTLDANAWNAVEFDRPVTSSPTTVVWNEVQAKLITGSYTVQSSANTNRATNGSNDDTTVGKTILLRDFDPSGKSNLNSNTPINSTSGRFQAS